MILPKVPLYKQKTEYTCGPASLKIVLSFFGKAVSESKLSHLVGTKPKIGANRANLVRVAEQLGFMVESGYGKTLVDIKKFLKGGLPVIVNYLWHDDHGHYSIVVGMERKRIIINDTYTGKIDSYNFKDFEKVWKSGDRRFGDRWLMVIKKRS